MDNNILDKYRNKAERAQDRLGEFLKYIDGADKLWQQIVEIAPKGLNPEKEKELIDALRGKFGDIYQTIEKAEAEISSALAEITRAQRILKLTPDDAILQSALSQPKIIKPKF